MYEESINFYHTFNVNPFKNTYILMLRFGFNIVLNNYQKPSTAVILMCIHYNNYIIYTIIIFDRSGDDSGKRSHWTTDGNMFSQRH